jgi:mono/diheme cytochrome c family protein
MNSRLLCRATGLALLICMLVLGLTACQPDARAQLISPQLGEQLTAQEAGTQIVVQPTPEPLTFAQLTDEEIYAGMPDDLVVLLQNADPGRGQNLALVNGCIGCHSMDPAIQMSGPTWFNIGDTSVNRVFGQGPAFYLWESIIVPNAYVVSGYPANVMPQNYDDLLSDEELADLVAYLLAQHGN